jgi:hypothetical protein
MENKNAFFLLDLALPNNMTGSAYYRDKVKDSVDLILASMGVEENSEEFEKKDKSRIIYFFQTSTRKRKGQLVKFCERFLPEDITYRAEGITKAFSDEQQLRLEKSTNFQKQTRLTEYNYNGDDIKILDNRNNWKPWQTEIFSKFLNPDMTFKKPESRVIYSLVDTEGLSGKSIFFKWLLVNLKEENIGKITFGTVSQLRSSIISMGPKKMYILDLTRSKGRDDNEYDLMSVLESIVDGMVSSPMYGKGLTLLMEPPHIMITSNYLLDYELLSLDRWKVYEIKKDGTLGKENEIFQNKERRKEILRRQLKKLQERLEARRI